MSKGVHKHRRRADRHRADGFSVRTDNSWRAVALFEVTSSAVMFSFISFAFNEFFKKSSGGHVTTEQLVIRNLFSTITKNKIFQKHIHMLHQLYRDRMV